MLMPRKIKYRKQHRGRMKGSSSRGEILAFGDYGLKATTNGWISARQIESGRRAIVGHLKRGGRVWIRIFPDKPVSARPAESRMGGGKGALDHWVAPVKKGRIIYEIADVPRILAIEALRLAGHKLCVGSRKVTKEDLLK